jgi:hypothetical protein
MFPFGTLRGRTKMFQIGAFKDNYANNLQRAAKDVRQMDVGDTLQARKVYIAP